MRVGRKGGDVFLPTCCNLGVRRTGKQKDGCLEKIINRREGGLGKRKRMDSPVDALKAHSLIKDAFPPSP